MESELFRFVSSLAVVALAVYSIGAWILIRRLRKANAHLMNESDFHFRVASLANSELILKTGVNIMESKDAEEIKYVFDLNEANIEKTGRY